MTSPVTSLSKLPQTAIFPVNFAQDRNKMTTWNGTSSPQSSTNVNNLARARFPYIFLANHYCTQKYSMQSGILNIQTKEIRYFLRQMERYLTASPKTSLNYVLIESFGRGGKITLMMEPEESLNQSDLSGSSSRKPLKARLKNGKDTGKK